MKDEAARNRVEAQSRLNAKQEDYETHRQHALERSNGLEIETSRKSNDIITEINKIRMIIQENKGMADQENQNRIIAEYRQLNQTVGRLVTEMGKLMDYIDLLSRSIDDRKIAYHNLRFYIGRVV